MAREPISDTPDARLADAVRRVKIATAERTDVVVDMKEADRARLEILADELRPIFDQVPPEDERFDFAISSGIQPRLWIDATAHVIMGRDRRTYRFVRDTRSGRVVLAEAMSIEPVVDRVTLYIAERLHEREMAFAADEIVSYRPGISQRPTAATSLAGSLETLRRAEHDERTLDRPAEARPGTMPTGAGRAASAPTDAPEKPDPNAIGPAVWAAMGAVVAFGLFILALRDQLL